jgi:hypothetical protein
MSSAGKATPTPTETLVPPNVPPSLPPELAAFDDGQPFSRESNLAAVNLLVQQTAANYLEIGRRFILHKHYLPHGQFQEDLASTGISYRSAAQMMNAARKLLPANVRALAHLPVTKVFLLAEELSPAELNDLAEQEATDIVHMDEIERMTVRELRDKLRKGRKHNKKLADHKERIKELEAENDALRGHRHAPTVEFAGKCLRAAYDHLDAACRELNKVELPDEDDGDLDSRTRILGKMAAFFTDWNTRSTNLYEYLVRRHLAEDA